MFVLTRYRTEGIVLSTKGGDVLLGTIRVLEILGNKVKLGLDFGDSITIDREEVFSSMEVEDGAPEPGRTESPGPDLLPRPDSSPHQT